MAAGELIVFREIDGHRIAQRRADGAVNATAMCKAKNKRLNDYLRLASTAAFLAEISSVTGIPATGLIEVRQGGNPGEQGTWVHRRVAIHLAQWCSPRFAALVSEWVDELLTRGSVAIPEPSGDPIIDQAVLLIETRRSQLALAQQLRETGEQISVLVVQGQQTDAKATAAGQLAAAAFRRAESNHGFVSVLGWHNLHGREVPETEAATYGKALTGMCKDRGITPGKVRDSRYGQVNTYPESLLREFFAPIWGTK